MLRKSSIPALILAAGSVLACATLHADITLEERLSVEGAGLMRMANMTGTTKTTIAGDRSRIESDLQMQSRLVRMVARGVGGPTADIVRLDEGKVYQLDLKKKQYTESTFEEMRAKLEAAQRQAQQQAQQAGGQTTPTPLDESECEWSEPKAEVKRTGEKAQFAGYDSERLMILASQSCRNKKTGAVCDVALSLDQWLAPNFSGGADALQFQRAYAQKMGYDAAVSQDLAERAKSMFGRYQGVWTQVAEKTRDVKGYPVKTSFAFAVGGPQCQDSQQPEGGTDESSARTPSGVAGQIVGSIFGRKKAQDSATAPTTSAASSLPPGMVPLITMTSELTSASTAPATPGTFDVPADFKKATTDTQ
jgi:hypothetical protein